MKIFKIVFSVLILCGCAAVSARAQYCTPSYVSLIVFDEKGKNIDPTSLEEPSYSKEDVREISELYGETLATPYKAVLLKSTDYCATRIDSLILKMGAKTMRLNFNVIFYTAHTRTTDNAAGARLMWTNSNVLVKLPPFGKGTFEFVPAEGDKESPLYEASPGTWKKISKKVKE